jgi:hypothetical protein
MGRVGLEYWPNSKVFLVARRPRPPPPPRWWSPLVDEDPYIRYWAWMLLILSIGAVAMLVATLLGWMEPEPC